MAQGIEFDKTERLEPFQKCPVCGEYKLEEWKHYEPYRERDGRFLFVLPSWTTKAKDEAHKHYKKCGNCNYREDIK